MPRSFLRARSDLGEPRVERPPLRRCGARPDRRAEQGVREAETLPVDLEDSGLDRLAQSGLCPAAGGRLDEAHRRVGERGNDPRHLEPGSPEAIDTLVNELFQIRGNWQLLARTHPAASSLKRTRELEGEERIPARCFPDAQESRSGKDSADARSQQLVQRADAERAELDASGAAPPARPCVARAAPRRERSGSRRPAPPRGGAERTGASPATVRRATGRRRSRAAAGCRRRASARCSGRRTRQRPPRRVRPSDSESASAASSARRCGRGSCGNTSGTTPPIRSASPTNENAASASAGRQESTR